MNIRYIGQLLSPALLLVGVVQLGKSDFTSQWGWCLLVTALVALALLFGGWKSVGQRVGAGAQRAAPHLRAGAQVVAGKARGNVVATAAIVSFVFFLLFTGSAIYNDSRYWAQAAAFALYTAIFFGILHAWGVKVFAEKWNACWLVISVVVAMHSFAFDWNGWITVASIASAILATVVIYFGPEEVLRGVFRGIVEVFGFAGRLFSGKYGASTACLAWTIVLAGTGFYLASSPARMNASFRVNDIRISVVYAVFLGAFFMAIATFATFARDKLVK